jgi:hypothetical protein
VEERVDDVLLSRLKCPRLNLPSSVKVHEA